MAQDKTPQISVNQEIEDFFREPAKSSADQLDPCDAGASNRSPEDSMSMDERWDDHASGETILSADEMELPFDEPEIVEVDTEEAEGPSHRKLPLKAGDYKFSKAFNSVDCVLRPKLNLTGLAAFPVQEIDSVKDYWPNNPQTNSINDRSYLRSLAAAYFYQANISRAHAILQRLENEESGEGNLGIILMKAECEIVFRADELKSFKKFKELIMNATLTEKDIEKWNTQLLKRGRFLGCLLLQFAAFYKFNNVVVKEPGPLSDDSVKSLLSRFNLIISSLPKMVEFLYQSLDSAMIEMVGDIYRMLPKIVDGHPQKAYVRALCYNSLAFLHAHAGSYNNSYHSARFGIFALESSSSHVELTKTVLYGNLLEHMAIGCGNSDLKDKAGFYRKRAVEVYETTEDSVTKEQKKKMRERLLLSYREGEKRRRLSKSREPSPVEKKRWRAGEEGTSRT